MRVGVVAMLALVGYIAFFVGGACFLADTDHPLRTPEPGETWSWVLVVQLCLLIIPPALLGFLSGRTWDER